MNNTKYILITFLCILYVGSSAGQDCMGLYPMTEGSVAEMVSYNKKGKMDMKTIQTVSDVNETAEGTEYTVKVVIFDEKGRQQTETVAKAVCKDGNFTITMESMLDEQTKEMLKDMKFEFGGENLTYPSNLTVGASLPDAEMVMKTSGAMNMKATLSVTNRKVLGKEKVTVPAGTYDCFVITSDQTLKMMANMTSTLKQYINEEVGLVKLEVYQKDKLQSTQELVSYKVE